MIVRISVLPLLSSSSNRKYELLDIVDGLLSWNNDMGCMPCYVLYYDIEHQHIYVICPHANNNNASSIN